MRQGRSQNRDHHEDTKSMKKKPRIKGANNSGKLFIFMIFKSFMVEILLLRQINIVVPQGRPV